ncbi:MAG: S8 family serine peptidase [Armatimonadetes bacterium]|nr:S8 family serine peptidase [Armatimonadota bacterium]
MISVAVLVAFSVGGGQGPVSAGPASDLVVRWIGSHYELSLRGGEPFHTTRQRVQNPRVVDVPGTPVRLALWDEGGKRGARTPFFGITLDGIEFARVTDTSYDVLLRYAEFDPLKGVPPVSPRLAADAENEIHIVQFVTQPLEEFRADIRAAGGTIYNFLANNAYLVRMTPQDRDRVASLPFVRWVGPYEPAYRMEEFLVENVLSGGLGDLRYNIQVFEKGPGQKATVAARVRAIGGVVNAEIPDGYILEATLTPEQLVQAAHWNEVFFIDRWGPPETDMNIARLISGGTYVEGVAGYRGQGVRGEVMDTNVLSTHVDFSSPALIFHGPRGGSSSHGTSTTGIVFGQGRANAAGMGMLPEAQGIFADFGFLGNRYLHTQQLVSPPYNAVFQSNSWGSGRTTAYTSVSAQMDDIIFDFDIIITQSQSNAGNQNSRPQAWAKNIVSVGGVRHFNTLTKVDDRWGGGASIGPAADGRVKPDFTHFYDSIFCPTSSCNTCYTTSFGGTSGATPIVAGHFGLMFQMWADGIFGQSAVGTTVFAQRPHFSTAKALMVNSAAQYDWTAGGANADLTRFKQGWGMSDVRNLYDRRRKTFVINETDVLTNLSSTTYRLYVTPGEPALRATLVYADPPGTTSSTQHRINDLTLKVTSPGGTVYWGNNGLIGGLWSTPGGVPNIKDTVENVFVRNPAAGVWRVEVQANQLVQDGHVETGPIDADYALVVSGVVAELAPTSMTVERGLLLSGAVADLETSNDARVEVRPWFVLSTVEPPVRVIVESQSPTASLTKMVFRLEASTSISNISQKIELLNYTSGSWEQVDSRLATVSDSVVNVVIMVNPSRFVDPGTRAVKARLLWKEGGPILSYPWRARIDQVRWMITP